MIVVENKRIGEIPLLHLAQKELFDEKLPLVIFVHGFTSAKEHNLHYAYLLAEKGFRVVLPEALYHGERKPTLSKHDLNIRFWEIVLKMIDDLDLIKTYFEGENKIDSQKIGLAGTSMGGIVTLGALTKYPWVKSAVSLMGMPYYEKFALWQLEELKKNNITLPLAQSDLDQLLNQLRELDLSLQPEKLANRPLLFWHGKQDTVVPYHFTYQFYKEIKTLYKKNPEYLQFISDEHADHKVSRDGVLKTVEWFEKHLLSSDMMYITSLGEPSSIK
ncbi:alpha/beta fold hydrolase [Bacillus sp. 31A1R]|uniref:Alpha/beta fold hydrolase n=1 Tax=Robertmurraya mangrovi TaxID=3098077 RepID=A0ABU5IT25_9BACI|nr:alpha/beta fold hydrolase [Bacillus sp. 31A1R]MDZ5470309.1 alpha/beta fold hydrolase [Bacillus sp. 31A1R]